ncbi:DUF6894 family protein (plasmid) [Microvirga sp. RSM25]|uniref:DUF6894 family protein n=1 Tax=Microvirga sp. RSM25 TaxID=3273802 RepID=UPI00384A96DB
MRCYFHLSSRHESISDDTGIEVAGLVEMQRQVVQAIEEFRQEAGLDEEDWRDWQLNVVDEAGNLLMAIQLDMLTAEANLHDSGSGLFIAKMLR